MKKWITVFCCCITIVASLKAQHLTKAEYFFNTDPGFGNGTPIVFTGSDSIQVNTNITLPVGLLGGLNILFVRVANTSGTWSFPEILLLWVSSAQQNISSAEYFFDIDPGFGQATPFTISTPDDSISITQSIVVPALSGGAHKLYVRTRNTDGTWSFPEVHPINICTGYGPTPEFSYYVNGPEVYFVDSSQLATTRKWNFGDNTASDTTVNPRHVFPQGNNYNVKLRTVNSCGVDSVIKSISIQGIQKISPAKASATGMYIGYVKGVGFKPGTTTRWLKNGSINVPADTTIFLDSTLLKVVFENNNEVVGQYDLLVNVPTMPEMHLSNAIVVEPPVNHDIWAALAGRRDILVNRWTTMKIVYGNNGNHTALGVPIGLKMPGAIEARLITHTYDSTLQQEFIDSTRDHFYITVDSLTNESTRIGYFIIPYLEPGATGELVFEIKSSAVVQFPVQIIKGGPFYSDTSFNLFGGRVRRNQRITSDFCDPPACIKLLIDAAGFAPGLGCATGIYGLGCSIKDMVESEEEADFSTVVDLIGSIGGAVLSCAGGGSIRSSIQKAADAVGNGTGAVETGGDALDCFDDADDFIRAVGSFDPNIKAGPHGYNTLQFTRWQDPFNYTIHFENLASATAPASEVVIIDYLDTTKLDMNSFRFTGFGFADTSFHFTIADNIFIKDIDMRPAKQAILRVTGLLDSVNKLSFRFTSFDPATMRLTTDFSQGFLNPNVDGAEGLGFVKFQVKPKSGLPTATIIDNEASIVFDANAVIHTSVWFNSIDKNKPESSILPITEKLNDTTFIVRWAGTDAHAGVRRYSIFVSVNDSAYKRCSRTDSLYMVFTGKINSNYKFYSRAEDLVGNFEDHASIADQQITLLPTPLPVTMVEFRAFKENKTAVLQWTTSYEQNNRGFEIQRSADGIHFTRIGWVDGSGNSVSSHTYHFIDSTPLKGKNFYRLNQIDLDNKSKLSVIRKLDFNRDIDFIIYPNPAKGEIAIQFNDAENKEIAVIDMMGRTVWSRKNITGTLLTIPLDQLSKGLYLVKVTVNAGKQSVQRFMKE